jgi:hypothetical protein
MGQFDIVASGLVLNFIPDPAQALSEMLRVARRGGTIGGYVWDFAADLSPTWPMRRGLRQLGASIAPTPGAENAGLTALSALFERAGLQGVVTNSVDVTMRFADFDDFWATHTPSFYPIAKMISKLGMSHRTRLIEVVRAEAVRSDGTVEYSARANAVSGRTPECEHTCLSEPSQFCCRHLTAISASSDGRFAPEASSRKLRPPDGSSRPMDTSCRVFTSTPPHSQTDAPAQARTAPDAESSLRLR